jgi:hypothetical protein
LVFYDNGLQLRRVSNLGLQRGFIGTSEQQDLGIPSIAQEIRNPGKIRRPPQLVTPISAGMDAYYRSVVRYVIFVQELIAPLNFPMSKLKLWSRTDCVNSMPSEHFKVASHGMCFTASLRHSPMRSTNNAWPETIPKIYNQIESPAAQRTDESTFSPPTGVLALIVVDDNMIDARIAYEEIESSCADEKGNLRIGKMAAKGVNYRCREGRIANKTETENQDIFNHAPWDEVRDTSCINESIDSEF